MFPIRTIAGFLGKTRNRAKNGYDKTHSGDDVIPNDTFNPGEINAGGVEEGLCDIRKSPFRILKVRRDIMV